MDKFALLMKKIGSCRDCKELFGHEPRPIFRGHKNAKIFQISQAPSQNVHNTGKSFNDLSGKKLRGEWYNISDEDFYNPKNFYISGIAHCYPGKNKNGGDNKPPVYCADKWLRKEMDSVSNKIYVIIGRYAAKYIFPDRDFTELISHNQKQNGKLCIVMPHPSPLNIKWFKDHPEFESKRIPEIRKIVHKALYR
jgi:uracil-DNA glycosylase family 4